MNRIDLEAAVRAGTLTGQQADRLVTFVAARDDRTRDHLARCALAAQRAATVGKTARLLPGALKELIEARALR